jgi:hypothetical protein
MAQLGSRADHAAGPPPQALLKPAMSNVLVCGKARLTRLRGDIWAAQHFARSSPDQRTDAR